MARRRRCDLPLAVLGGYLGAGKTTLLNRLLANARGSRIGVLVNDFGSVNIDQALIDNRDGETLSLNNGCVCCSIRNDLGVALESMLELGKALDQVIVEASGTADPARVATLARSWPGYRWGGAFVVVDAQQARMQVQDKFVGQHVRQQIAHANVLTLSKLDLLGESEARDAREWLAELAGDTPILEDVGALPELLSGEAAPEIDSKPSRALTVESYCFQSPSGLEIAALEPLLASLDPRILRAKGLVRTEAGKDWVVQKVGAELEISAQRPGARALERSELVFLAEPGFGDEAFSQVEQALTAILVELAHP